MITLGINISHNASICQVSNGKVDFYLEEERFNKIKHFGPWKNLKEKDRKYISLNSLKEIPKHVIYASFGRENYEKFCSETGEDLGRIKYLQKQLNKNLYDYYYGNEHHFYHAICGFYFSNFDEALCIVMDAGGSQIFPFYQEIESIYYLTKHTYSCKFKHLSNYLFYKNNIGNLTSNSFIKDDIEYKMSSSKSSAVKFGELSIDLGLDGGYDAGKVMGLSSYGNIQGNKPEDKAKRLQIETKNDTINLIEKALSFSKTKNIVLSGGYALNCVNNYEYSKHFKDYNMFVDPVAHDGGTAIGAALFLNKKLLNDIEK
jgi:carbamoyltransferase